MNFMCICVLFVVSLCKDGIAAAVLSNRETYWEGNWFPADPGADDTNRVVEEIDMHDDKHGIKMGIVDPDCDDAQRNLTLDWNGNANDYTCFDKKFETDYSIQPSLSCDYIPKKYWAQHVCMNKTIKYSHRIPTFGAHRPLWAVYGEYKFLPKQRWLHNLEHGGIVMLYHPCADSREVAKLKKLLKECLFRHVITSFPALTPKRPIALLSWGCRLLMSKVHEKTAVDFIRTHALHGPEINFLNGKYKKDLIQRARFVSDKMDSVLCPKLD